MSRLLPSLTPLSAWLADAGLPAGELEIWGGLLIVKLPPEDRRRLLSDAALRLALMDRARALGFPRLCLELSDSQVA